MDAKSARRNWISGCDRRMFLLAGIVFSGGCSQIIRGQSPDSDPLVKDDPNQPHFIGEIAGVWGTGFSKVESVGLVTQLDGTGSDPPSDQLRASLINEMKIQDVSNPNQVLASEDTSLVIVKGLLPPAIQRGERYDVEVYVPTRSKTTSLRGGYLLSSDLSPAERIGGVVKRGHMSSKARGNILVDGVFWEGDGALERHGRILGGGVALQSRPVGLYIRDESQSVSATVRIATAINRRFDTYQDGVKTGVANPKDNRIVELLIPRQYRLNLARYFSVVRSISYNETPEMRQQLLQRLESELTEPFVAAQAALKLEAIGEEAKPILLRALTLSDPELRFYAAESLAYLGVAEAAPVLGAIAKEESAFRWHAITALASMDDVSAGSALASLFHHHEIETRYGAFRAMQAFSPHDPTIAGEELEGGYRLHPIVSNGKPYIHFSRVRRPEIVLFGHDQRVGSNFLFVEQGLTVRVVGPDHVQIRRYDTVNGDTSLECSQRVDDVIRNLSRAGLDYGEVFRVFQVAGAEGMLEGKFAVHAVPNPNRRYQRGEEGEERYLNRGPLPNLFQEAGDDSGDDWQKDSGESITARDVSELPIEDKPSVWERMGGWFGAKKHR